MSLATLIMYAALAVTNPCPYDEAEQAEPCTWHADERGNHTGQSFIVLAPFAEPLDFGPYHQPAPAPAPAEQPEPVQYELADVSPSDIPRVVLP